MTEAQAAQRVGAQPGERAGDRHGEQRAEQQLDGAAAANAIAGAAHPVPAAVDVLRGYLGAQSTAFLTQLPRLRDGKPEASHRIRVACRRSRSLLRTYRPLMDGDWADELAARIADFTQIVSPERDVEVVR